MCKQSEREERMEDALRTIVAWTEAYPLNVFPEPDLVLVRQLLEAGGITLDAVSASAMRHVVRAGRQDRQGGAGAMKDGQHRAIKITKIPEKNVAENEGFDGPQGAN